MVKAGDPVVPKVSQALSPEFHGGLTTPQMF